MTRYNRFCVLVVLLLALLSSQLSAASIVLKANATWTERAAAGDLQRTIYASTGKLLPVTKSSAGEKEFIALGHSAGIKIDLSQKTLGDQGFVLKTVKAGGKTVIVAAGATPQATSYAAYTLAEEFGAGFYLGGDALPIKKRPFSLPVLGVVKKPALKIRGVLPWYNFFDSPTAWNAEDYRFFIDQLAKSKNNFLGFHSYDGEPFCAYKNREGKTASGAPLLSTASSTWGTQPMKTSEFGFGTGRYFDKEYFGSDCSLGNKTPEEGLTKAQKLLVDALWYARARGIKTCLGFEVYGDPTAPGALDELELRLRNLVKTYPMLDYVWIWEPEAMGVWGSEVHQSRTDFGAYYRRWEKAFSDITDPKRKSEAVRVALFAQAAHRILKKEAPNIKMVLSGWGGDHHCHFTDFYPGYDQILPRDIIFSALDDIITSDTVSEAYGKLSKEREFWPIPWFEFDGDQWFPQPNTKHFSNNIRDALKKGAKGMLAIHWRTRDMEESHAYISQFAWDPQLSYEGFYRGYARKGFGDMRAAKLLMDLQSLGYRWIGGSGQMECGNFAWGPAPEDGVDKLTALFTKHCAVRECEPLDYLRYMAYWAEGFDSAARLVHQDGDIRTLLNTIESEKRDPTTEEKDKLAKSIRVAHESLRRGMHAYSRRVSNRGELGVLATINTKAWADLREVEERAQKLAGIQLPEDTPDQGPIAVSSILRSTTAFAKKPFRISALVYSASPKAKADAVYRLPGGKYKSASLKLVNSGRIEGFIPASDVKEPLLEYYIRVTDGPNKVIWPQPNALHKVSVVPEAGLTETVSNPAVHRLPAMLPIPPITGSLLVQLDWACYDDYNTRIFKVLRTVDSLESWKEVATTRDHWYEDRGVEAGTNYAYRIVDAETGKTIADYDGMAVLDPPLPEAPKVQAQAGFGRVKFRYKAIDVDTNGCTLYRSEKAEGPFTKVEIPQPLLVQTGEWTFTVPAEEGKEYFYKLRALSLNGIEGPESEALAIKANGRNMPPTIALNFDGKDTIKAPDTTVEDGTPAIRVTPDQWMQIPHSDSFNTINELTVQFRLKLSKAGSIPVFVCHGQYDQDGFFVQYLGGKVRFYLGGVGVLDAGTIEIGKWTDIAATYDGSQMAIYLNGQLAGSKPAAGEIVSTNKSLYIGRYEYPGKEFEVDGYIGRLRIYPYARTAEEIKQD